MSQQKCHVVAIFKPFPHEFHAIKKLLSEITLEVCQEPGCEAYQLHESVEGELVFIETWTTRALWETHNQASTVARIRAGIKDKLESDVRVIEMYATPS